MRIRTPGKSDQKLRKHRQKPPKKRVAQIHMCKRHDSGRLGGRNRSLSELDKAWHSHSVRNPLRINL